MQDLILKFARAEYWLHLVLDGNAIIKYKLIISRLTWHELRYKAVIAKEESEFEKVVGILFCQLEAGDRLG